MLSPLTKAASDSFVDQAHLCRNSFTPDEDAPDSEVKNPVLSTLTRIISRVIDAEILEAIAELIYWVNTMHFAASIMRCAPP